MIVYCFKLYNSKRNNKLNSKINIAGSIYNHCISLHKRYYRLFNKQLNMYKLQSHITKLKKLKKNYKWGEVGSQAIQDITQRIDNGYRLFFRNLSQGIKASPPSFKKICKYKSFTLKQAGWKYDGSNIITIQGQKYKFHKSRDVKGDIKTITVKRDALNSIYIYIACVTDKPSAVVRADKKVGYDFGLKTFLTASDGNDFESPKFFKQNLDSVKKARKILSRKMSNSSNYERARIRVAKVYNKITNQRKDFHFKLALNIVKENSVICIEDLDIKKMQKRYGRAFADLGFANFVRILEHQAIKSGSKVIKIPRFYPSSKTCSSCLNVVDKLPLKIRHWVCPKCGYSHDRDKNAAINILRVGASTLQEREYSLQ